MSDTTEKLLAKTHTVTFGKQTFEFALPTIATQLKLGVRARSIRRAYDPLGYGEEVGLDEDTALLAWGSAAFEVLLVGCDAESNWPYSKTEAGAPVVDYTKWPAERLDDVLEVARTLWGDLQRFRAERALARQPPGSEAVAGS